MERQLQSSVHLVHVRKLHILIAMLLLNECVSAATATEIGSQATGQGGAVAAGHADSVAAEILTLEKGGRLAIR